MIDTIFHLLEPVVQVLVITLGGTVGLLLIVALCWLVWKVAEGICELVKNARLRSDEEKAKGLTKILDAHAKSMIDIIAKAYEKTLVKVNGIDISKTDRRDKLCGTWYSSCGQFILRIWDGGGFYRIEEMTSYYSSVDCGILRNLFEPGETELYQFDGRFINVIGYNKYLDTLYFPHSERTYSRKATEPQPTATSVGTALSDLEPASWPMDMEDAAFENEDKDKAPFIIRNDADGLIHKLTKDTLEKLHDIHKNVENNNKDKTE
jgi:hypothetical protein